MSGGEVVRRTSRCAVVVVLALLLAACGSGEPEPAPTADGTQTAGGTYVALGDSAASGMGIAPEQPGDRCRRSARAYPPLLAQRHDLELDNRTCAGARIADVLGDSGRGGSEPQVAAVDAQTMLVTVMIGANDLGYAGLVDARCAADADGGAGAGACSTADARAAVDQRLRTFAVQLRRLLEEIDRRAPQAQALVVGYGDALGAGPCPAVPLTRAAYDVAAATVRGLNAALEEAADEAGAAYVDTYAATRGHGVCDDEPWTNGFTTDGDGAIGHPRSAYHAAVADLLDDVLD